MSSMDESAVDDQYREIFPTQRYSDRALGLAAQRRDAIQAIVDGGRPYLPAVLKAREESGLSVATLYRAVARYEGTRDLRTLIPPVSRRAFRLPTSVLDLLNEFFHSRYQSKQRINPTRFAKEVRLQCKIRGLPVPCESTVKRHLKRLIDVEGLSSVERRRGNRRAAELLTARQGTFAVERPLDTYQIDHTPLDIVIVSEASGLPIGRPYLTVAIDVKTRMVAGLHVGLDAPSMNTVGLCLANAILPKASYLKRLDLDERCWPIYGLPDVIHTDNAREFIGNGLARFAQIYDVRLEHRPVAAPRFGGHIERFIRTINSEVHNWEGTTHSNVVMRGEYDSQKHAALSLQLLERRLVNFITGEYHNRRHSSLACSPLAAFREALLAQEDTFGIGLPRDLDEVRLRLDLLPTKECTVQRNGVTINRFTYVGEALAAYVGRKDSAGRTERFLVAYDPSYMNEVYFYAHDVNEYFTLRLRDESAPSINIWEKGAIQKRLRAEDTEQSEDAILRAHQVDIAIAEEARGHQRTMRQERKRERRRRVSTSPRAIAFQHSPDEPTINWDMEPLPLDTEGPL